MINLPLHRFHAFIARRLRVAARDEGGYLIVELMVGAIVMVMLALGTLQAFDGAAKVSTTTKTRALAASLAQEEQERIRGLTVDQLNRMNSTTSQTIGGITYTINSKTEWLADATSTPSCTSNGKAADYLKATTTVTPNKSLGKPVVLTTLVTAPNGTFAGTQGALSLSVLNRSGVGTPGIAVTLTGPSGGSSVVYNDTTDANGCVFYGYLPIGTYTADFNQTGYVDKDGNNFSPKGSGITVASEGSSTASFTYDQAGSAIVNFDTKAYGSSTATTAYATNVNFQNEGVSGSGARTFGNGSTYVSSYPASTVSNLFPFTTNYSIFAGTAGCTGVDTSALAQIITPGSSPTLTVRVPAINAIVATNTQNPGNNGAGSLAAGGARVEATPSGTGCPAAFYLGATSPSTIAGTGRFANPGAPYGSYNLCADYDFDLTSGTTWRKTTRFKNSGGTTVSQPIANTDPNGTTNLTATIYRYNEGWGQPDNGSTSGQC